VCAEFRKEIKNATDKRKEGTMDMVWNELKKLPDY